jgi:hypothetical protein
VQKTSILNFVALFVAAFTLSAADYDYINTPKLVSDNYGGVCYTRPIDNSVVAVHRYADGYEEVYSSPEASGTIGNTLGCSPQFIYFTVGMEGVMTNRLYRQHFGTSVVEVIIDPQAATGITSTRFVATLGIETKTNRVIAVVVDSQSEVYAIELGDKTSIVGDLGQFSSFNGTCATNNSLYALLNIGNLTQLMELTPKGVNTMLVVLANGDGVVACNSFGAFVGYHTGSDLVLSDSNGNKTIFLDLAGRLGGLAVSDNGNAMVVINNGGNQTFGLAGSKSSKLQNGPLSLASLPTTVVVSNDSFTIGSYLPKR